MVNSCHDPTKGMLGCQEKRGGYQYCSVLRTTGTKRDDYWL